MTVDEYIKQFNKKYKYIERLNTMNELLNKNREEFVEQPHTVTRTIVVRIYEER
jgi:hypothetical protein